MLQKRQSSGCDGTDALRGQRLGPHLDEFAERSLDEEGRVVVAVAAAGPVDEDGVASAQLGLPTASLELVRELAEVCAAFLLDGGADTVVAGGGPAPAAASTAEPAPGRTRRV